MSNAHLFAAPKRSHSYLRARGFDDNSGQQSGGIVEPKEVELLPGTVLIRLFERYKGTHGYGDWWTTPYEFTLCFDYFGRPISGDVLRNLLALLPWWPKSEMFHVVKIRNKLHAFYGEGDTARGRRLVPNEVQAKPAKIMGANGKQHAVRQLYIPDFRFTADFEILELGLLLSALESNVRKYNSGGLIFEK